MTTTRARAAPTGGGHGWAAAGLVEGALVAQQTAHAHAPAAAAAGDEGSSSLPLLLSRADAADAVCSFVSPACLLGNLHARDVSAIACHRLAPWCLTPCRAGDSGATPWLSSCLGMRSSPTTARSATTSCRCGAGAVSGCAAVSSGSVQQRGWSSNAAAVCMRGAPTFSDCFPLSAVRVQRNSSTPLLP